MLSIVVLNEVEGIIVMLGYLGGAIKCKDVCVCSFDLMFGGVPLGEAWPKSGEVTL